MRLIRLLLVLLVVAMPAAAKDGASRFAGLDGFLVHYKSWGKASDEAVILIHGYGMDQSLWRLQVPALAKTHRVIAMDSPGHGDSARPKDAVFTMDLYARAVEAVAQDAGVKRAVLIGHSMGLPVIHTVLRRGKLAVTKAVFVDGAIVVPPTDPKKAAEQEKWMKDFSAALKTPEYRVALEQFFAGFSPKLPRAWKKEIGAKVRDVDQHMASSTFDHFADADVWAPARHDIPVLALYAEMSTEGAKDWLAANYPKARMVVWNDVDHFPQLEQPERVNKAILKFLK
ncbi:MAG TPA: alpha/beta hydrolase [Candidatus Omnitrophota bacterium]|nr:alpha/beta hydrolase [Candidatus Omnitrophota bacterium]